MLDEHVIFFEAAGVQEDRQPFAGGQPPFRMLRRNTLFAAAEPRRFPPFFEFFDRRGHDSSSGALRFGALLPRLGAPGQSLAKTLLRCTTPQIR